MSAVAIEQVTEIFRQHVAVDDLSLQCRAAYLRLHRTQRFRQDDDAAHDYARFLPDRGVIRVLDEQESNGSNRSILDRVAYLPEERGLYKQMKSATCCVLRRVKGVSPQSGRNRSWLTGWILHAWGDKKVDTLSKGMSQKVQFIATVIARPEWFCSMSRSAVSIP